MTVYRFTVNDPMSDWVRAIEVEADDGDQALRRASSWLFSRRDVGSHETLVRLTPVDL